MNESTAVEEAPPEVVTEAMVQVCEFMRAHEDLYPTAMRGKALQEIFKLANEKAIESAQGVTLGRKQHPFDRVTVNKFQVSNVHHSTCIKTKTAATTGLGFESEEDADGLTKVDKIMNPLCENSFSDVVNDVQEDYWQCGEGGYEIVRESDEPNAPILGCHHIPCAHLHRFLEDTLYNSHFEIVTGEGSSIGRRFARYGDLTEFKKRTAQGNVNAGSILFQQDDIRTGATKDIRSEVIILRNPTSLSRWYGFPDWLAATASIELVQCFLQFQFDFFLNRGVPEFMLFILGQKLGKEDWKKVEDAIKANIGLGNSHKSMALNLNNKDIVVQLEKLAMESKSDEGQVKLKENLALDIVSAHRVPPLLAGIQTPGKLGASNELPNAIMAFQLLVIAPAQRIFEQTLGCTLGDKTNNGGLDLTPKDFKLKKITDQMNLDMMATVGGMRETVTEANASGRDVAAGLEE